LGYLQRADSSPGALDRYFDRHTRRLYQRFQWNFNWWQYWTAAGLPEERAFNTNTHTTFNNTWSFTPASRWEQLARRRYDCARGGPPCGRPVLRALGGLNGDDRKAIVPYFWVIIGGAMAGGRTASC